MQHFAAQKKSRKEKIKCIYAANREFVGTPTKKMPEKPLSKSFQYQV